MPSACGPHACITRKVSAQRSEACGPKFQSPDGASPAAERLFDWLEAGQTGGGDPVTRQPDLHKAVRLLPHGQPGSGRLAIHAARDKAESRKRKWLNR